MKKEGTMLFLGILLLVWVNALTIHFLEWSHWYDIPLLVTYNGMWILAIFALEFFWNVLVEWKPTLFFKDGNNGYSRR